MQKGCIWLEEVYFLCGGFIDASKFRHQGWSSGDFVYICGIGYPPFPCVRLMIPENEYVEPQEEHCWPLSGVYVDPSE